MPSDRDAVLQRDLTLTSASACHRVCTAIAKQIGDGYIICFKDLDRVSMTLDPREVKKNNMLVQHLPELKPKVCIGACVARLFAFHKEVYVHLRIRMYMEHAWLSILDYL